MTGKSACVRGSQGLACMHLWVLISRSHLGGMVLQDPER